MARNSQTNTDITATDSSPSLPGPTVAAVGSRNAALLLLAVMATVYTLYWAKDVLIPIVISGLLAYALSPVVSALHRLKLPRPLGAALVLAVLVSLSGYAAYVFKGQAETVLDRLPQAIGVLTNAWRTDALAEDAGKPGLLEKLQVTAAEIDKATLAAVGTAPSPIQQQALTVTIEEPAFDLRRELLSGSLGALILIGQSGAVLVLVFLLLATGDFYKRKLVRLSGSTLSEKKITVQIIDDFNEHIRNYLFVLLLSAILVGLLTWIAFTLLGMEQAGLWGVIAGVACLIPYLGPLALCAATGMSALAQFGTVTMGITVGAIAFLAANIQSGILTPWLTSRSTQINRVALFVGLLFLGWLWGPVGLILSTPVLIVIKVCCDHIDNFRPLGELLGPVNPTVIATDDGGKPDSA